MSRLIIFDVDGTLSDSMGTIVHAWREAIRKSSLPEATDAALRHGIGRSIPECFSELYPHASSEQYDMFAAHYRTIYRGLVVGQEPPLYDGVRETLQALQKGGHTLAIATGKSRAGLDRMLDAHGLRQAFQSTMSGDQARSKPHPEMIERILLETGMAPQEAIMVGDTTYDLLMARAAGVRSVAVTYGGHDRDTLLACAPDHMIDDIQELVPWVIGKKLPSPPH